MTPHQRAALWLSKVPPAVSGQSGHSTTYTAAVGLVANDLNVVLPADFSVDIEVDLGQTAGAYFLQARLTLRVPGLPLDIATTLAHTADQICPYSKATRGNIDVALNVLTA